MKQKQLLCYSIAIMLLFANCKKSNPIPIPDNTVQNQQFLIGNWHLVGQFSDLPFDWNGDGMTETEMYALLDSCDKKYYLKFDNDTRGSLSLNCRSYTPIQWDLENRGNKIKIFPIVGTGREEDIVKIDQQNLTTTKKVETSFRGVTRIVTSIYKKE